MGMQAILSNALGLDAEPRDLTVLQVCLRAIIVFIVAIVIVRLGHKRFLSKMSALDAVLGFMLASALARAINGSAPFFPTLVMGFVLVFLHRGLSALTFYSAVLGRLTKGSTNVLVENGKPDRNMMKHHSISEADLFEEARLHGNVGELREIKTATLERSGEISIIPAESSH